LEHCYGGSRPIYEKKYVSEEETPFAKHAFLQQQDWDMFVQETNSLSFQQSSEEMKQKRALHNKTHKTGRKGYRGKRKEWEEEDAKLAVEGNGTLRTHFLDVPDLICGQG
jgi:hypothetical protein